MSETIRVTVAVTDDELRLWAGRHADAGHHGVAVVLYNAVDKLEIESVELIEAQRWAAWFAAERDEVGFDLEAAEESLAEWRRAFGVDHPSELVEQQQREAIRASDVLAERDDLRALVESGKAAVAAAAAEAAREVEARLRAEEERDALRAAASAARSDAAWARYADRQGGA